MITFDNARYVYDGFALHADLTVPRHCLCAVLGASGSGKSTLLSLIAGFETLASGKLAIAGTDVTLAAPGSRPVSMIFQDHNAFAHLDCRTNVALGISPSLSLTGADNTRIDTALARVGLTHLAKRKPGEMSGGELQRVALARALVRDKPVLLLDEPFAALDPGLHRQMLALVAELHAEAKLTTLLVTHQPNEIRHVCDKVIFVESGVVRKPVTSRTFFADGSEPVRAYLGT